MKEVDHDQFVIVDYQTAIQQDKSERFPLSRGASKHYGKTDCCARNRERVLYVHENYVGEQARVLCRLPTGGVYQA